MMTVTSIIRRVAPAKVRGFSVVFADPIGCLFRLNVTILASKKTIPGSTDTMTMSTMLQT